MFPSVCLPNGTTSSASPEKVSTRHFQVAAGIVMLALADSPTKSAQSHQFQQLATWSVNVPPAHKTAVAKIIRQWAVQNSPPNQKHSDTVRMLLEKAFEASPRSRRAKQVLKRLENATGICHQLSTVVPRLARALEIDTDKSGDEQREGESSRNETAAAASTRIPTTSDDSNLAQSINITTDNISPAEPCSSTATLTQEEGALEQRLESKADVKEGKDALFEEASTKMEENGVVSAEDTGEEEPSREASSWEDAHPVNMIAAENTPDIADTINTAPAPDVLIEVESWSPDTTTMVTKKGRINILRHGSSGTLVSHVVYSNTWGKRIHHGSMTE